MSDQYYKGMFSSLKHNILLMLSQIEANIEYSNGEDFTEELEYIQKRCDKIMIKFAKQKDEVVEEWDYQKRIWKM